MFLSLPAPQWKARQLTDNCNTPETARQQDLNRKLQKQGYTGAEQNNAKDDVWWCNSISIQNTKDAAKGISLGWGRISQMSRYPRERTLDSLDRCEGTHAGRTQIALKK